jgi:hypothetical protein
MFFDQSRPDRQKRASKGVDRMPMLAASPIPKAKPYELLTDADLQHDRTLVFDTESYKNYWLAGFKCTLTGKVIYFEDTPVACIDVAKLAYVLHRFLCVGFNSNSYDLPILQMAMKGERATRLHEVSWQIVSSQMRAYDIEREYKLPRLRINHIDLIEVAPIQASLKIYTGRLHCERMQDLPFPPEIELNPDQAAIVRDYNLGNDLPNTALLYKELLPQIELRESLGAEYGVDLRSKSDAQIAETVIGSELDRLHSFGWDRAKHKQTPFPDGAFFYRVPEAVTFRTPQLQGVLEAVRTAAFRLGAGGQATIPEAIASLRIELGACLYQMGGGGLHSTEKAAAHRAGPGLRLIDRDVASYYPAIILNQGLFPAHLGPDFLTVYRAIVQRRLRAKLDKNKVADQGLKITINGTFGKLGNVYSRLYAPDLLMQVTISGQLFLLMLIEAIELADIPVISANTDGVVIACPPHRYDDLQNVVLMWEGITGFATEETEYRALYSRDVNNYIAIKLDGECKVKGIYSDKGSALNSVLSKNPEGQIISDAVQAFLAHNKPLAETIRACTDIRKFVHVRTVKGGAEKNGVYLGKAIRWYYAEGETGFISYVLSGNMVPKSEGAKPLMELPPALPDDLDFGHYIREAEETLFDLGFYKRATEARLF